MPNQAQSMKTLNPIFDTSVSDNFTATLAHEIRNPLATIELSVDLILNENINEDLRAYMEIIKRSTTRINDLVNEMIKKNQDEVQIVNQSVQNLLDEVVEMALDRINLKNIMVCKEYDPKDCITALNRPKMKIALTNIIVNAIEAMAPHHGELKLVTTYTSGRYVVQIKDNGCGISEKNLKKIFLGNYSNRPGGLGYGLASTYDILMSNNVSVHVESQLGTGTQFLLLFGKI